MKTKNVLKNEKLWQRIQEFSLDAQSASFPFSKKLAKEEKWSLDFTKRAIDEYKKFVYLCCISPNGASPSEIVDKVWHLHLIYTQNYWEDFCPNVLKMNLHHHPSNGGNKEKSKHENWFLETLENYKTIFQQEPPKDIWEKQEKKTMNTGSLVRLLKLLSCLGLLLILFSCSDRGFSTIFFILFWIGIVLFVLITIIRTMIGSSHSKNKEGNDINSNSDSGNSCSSTSGNSCSGGSSCGSGCGGGCGGCGGS